MSENNETTRLFRSRDPRIDRAVGWGLNALVALVLSFVGYQVRVVSERIETMAGRVETVARSIAVLEAGGGAAMTALDARMREVERHVSALEALTKGANR